LDLIAVIAFVIIEHITIIVVLSKLEHLGFIVTVIEEHIMDSYKHLQQG